MLNRIIEIPYYLRQTTLDGCGGVGVSTRDCGSLSPGSIPGHGPINHPIHRGQLSVPFAQLWSPSMNDWILQHLQRAVLY